MRILFWLIMLVIATPVSAAITSPCHVDGLETAVECGTLHVALDPAKPTAEQLEIGYVVLPAFNPSTARRPLFFLAGGPGQSATGLASQVNRMFADARANRDIVLIDQRGTGRSAALQCDAPELESLAAEYDQIDPDALARCVAQLPEGIEHFTTANAIADFEQVRKALGYEQIDLYGGSYGSRAAIAYLAIAGDAVGAVILDGISPPSVPIGLFGISAAAAFERAITRCHAISECAAAFPKLRDDFASVDARLRRGPVETRIPHPTTGQMTDFRLWHSQFISLLRLTLYDPDSTALLPLLITEAAGSHYRPLAALAAASSTTELVNIMLNLTIVCNEDYVRFDAVSIARDSANQFGRDTSFRLWNEACPMMPRFTANTDWMTAGPFPHPALLLSGAADPVTPPSNGERASGLFTQYRHIIAPERAHIVASSDCGGEMIAAFLETNELASLETGCLAKMPRQRFRLDRMGSLSIADNSGDAP